MRTFISVYRKTTNCMDIFSIIKNKPYYVSTMALNSNINIKIVPIPNAKQVKEWISNKLNINKKNFQVYVLDNLTRTKQV